MSGWSNVPNFDSWIQQCWGGPVEVAGFGGFLSAASNVVVGSNPPYYADQFFTFYPKFGGVGANAPAIITGDITQGSAEVTNVSSATSLAAAQLITTLNPGNSIPAGTLLATVTPGSPPSLTLTNPALITQTAQSFIVYIKPLVPMLVLNAYIALASSSIIQARWVDTWIIGMGLYIAHFATLWLRSDGDMYCDTAQAAIAGLAKGITISKGAGATSQGLQIPDGWDDWGTFGLTLYGQEFMTFARSMGAGPMLIY